MGKVLLFLSLASGFSFAWSFASAQAIPDYPARYGVRDRYTKIVNNRGQGEERLYGVRNARIVFKNVLRGGANNVYHRDHPRGNNNPLQEDALRNLCEEGITDANYLYPTNFSSAPKEVPCRLRSGEASKLRYHNLRFAAGEDEKVLELVRDHLTGKTRGGLYLHCWNGWHASGYMAAISLIQFCGMSHSDAVDYWNRNTDGVNSGAAYELVRQRIREFQVVERLKISRALQEEVCVL